MKVPSSHAPKVLSRGGRGVDEEEVRGLEPCVGSIMISTAGTRCVVCGCVQLRDEEVCGVKLSWHSILILLLCIYATEK